MLTLCSINTLLGISPVNNQTITPDLIQIGNFRAGTPTDDGNPRTFVDYTFDQAAELSGGDVTNFNLIPTDGGPVIDAEELIEGENTTVYTIAYIGTINAADIARGFIDSNTVRVAGAEPTNPLQSVDVSNGGNTTDPDLVSVIPNFTTNELVYTFDQTINIDDDAGFGFYDRQGQEFDGDNARQLNSTTVAVEFDDVQVSSAIGATVDNGAVADLDDDSNQPDEVLVDTDNSTPVVLQSLNSAGTSGTEDSDILVGTDEAEEIQGLGGNDVIQGDAGSDTLDGGEGTDTVVYQLESTQVTVDLTAGTASNQNGDDDTLIFIENVIGSDFNDRIDGDNESNSLTGGRGSDTISGSGGDDFIVGSAGSDNLTGGTGADNFVYLSPSDGSDTITDFAPESDRISVVSLAFGGDLTAGSLSESRFTLGSMATNSQQRFIYNDSTGELFYDIDGTGQIDRQLLATFEGSPNISADDIAIL